MITQITKTSEYKDLQNKGKVYKSKYFICIIQFIEEPELRFGITASRKIGNAVKRNKIKRQLRHIIYSSNHINNFVGIKVNFIAKKYIINVEYDKIMQDIISILGKIYKEKNI